MEHSETEIMLNLNEQNVDFLECISVYKFPSGRTFKFECLTTEMAKKCVKNGIFLFNLVLNSRWLALEDSKSLDFCFKCYSMNDHLASSCKKPAGYKICSLCSSTNHTYKECTANEKKNV